VSRRSTRRGDGTVSNGRCRPLSGSLGSARRALRRRCPPRHECGRPIRLPDHHVFHEAELRAVQPRHATRELGAADDREGRRADRAARRRTGAARRPLTAVIYDEAACSRASPQWRRGGRLTAAFWCVLPTGSATPCCRSGRARRPPQLPAGAAGGAGATLGRGALPGRRRGRRRPRDEPVPRRRRGLRSAFDTAILLTNSFGSALQMRLAGIPARWGTRRTCARRC